MYANHIFLWIHKSWRRKEEKRENCKLKRQRERDLKIEKKCERKKEVMKGNRERERLCKKERYIEWNEEKHTEN